MKKIFKIFCIFFVCLILSLCILSMTISKYSTKVDVNVNSNVAKPIICFQESNYQDIDVLGEKSISYEFSIKNYNDEVSDVFFKYKLMFEYSQENAPILINLYKKCGDSEEKVELLRKSNCRF